MSTIDEISAASVQQARTSESTSNKDMDVSEVQDEVIDAEIIETSLSRQDQTMVHQAFLACKDKDMLMDQYGLLKDKYEDNSDALQWIRETAASTLMDKLKKGELTPEEYQAMLESLATQEPDFARILMFALLEASERDKHEVNAQNERNQAEYKHDLKVQQRRASENRAGLFNFGGGSNTLKEPESIEPNKHLFKTLEQSRKIVSALLSTVDQNKEDQKILNILNQYSLYNKHLYNEFNEHMDIIDKQEKEIKELKDIWENEQLNIRERNQAKIKLEEFNTNIQLDDHYKAAARILSKLIDNNDLDEELEKNDFLKAFGMNDEDADTFKNRLQKIVEHEKKENGGSLLNNNPFMNFFNKIKLMLTPEPSLGQI